MTTCRQDAFITHLKYGETLKEAARAVGMGDRAAWDSRERPDFA